MELVKFIKLLVKRKWLLIGLPIFVIILTYFLVRNLPDTYASHARMATGLVDQSQQILSSDAFQESKVNLDFSNLIEMTKLKKVYDQVSFKLILHDLEDSVPFREPSKLMKELVPEAKRNAIKVIRKHYTMRQPLSTFNADEAGMIKLISSLGYDYDGLDKSLRSYRPNSSDFIDIYFESENANLSAFVVNSLAQEFINYYADFVKNNKLKSVNFLDTVMRQKEAEMYRLKGLLKNYKIENRVLNLAEQAKSLYGQLADFETRKQIAEKDVIAYNGALQGINDKFSPVERKYVESTMVSINQQIASTKQYILNLSDEYIKSNYDDKIKNKLDSARKVVSQQIQVSTDKYITNPLAAKENLVNQKARIELDLDIAKFSQNSLKDELVRLNKKFDLLVPHEAVIQNYESAIDVASKEYLDAQSRYNKSSMESSLSISLRQIENGVPGAPSPSKKLIIVIVAGMVTEVLILLVLFVLFYLDESVIATKELANHTNLPVLGQIPLLSGSIIELKKLWNNQFDENLKLRNFKEMLRSTRFEIENEMAGSKVLMLNSLGSNEGKTLISMSLAFAFMMVRKKVLIIDGNFDNNSISKMVEPQMILEAFLNEEQQLPDFRPVNEIMVMGNNGGDTSLLEVSLAQNITSKMDILKEAFDIIIIDAPGLSRYNKSKEWVQFSEKVVTVFESGHTISFKNKQDVLYLKSLDHKFIGWILNKENNEKPARSTKSTKTIFSKNIEMQWA
jgi:capsular polysaccharide biosynthesis protein/Mrp family chromosome partitioning ATPase